MTIDQLIIAALPSLLTAIVMAVFNRKQAEEKEAVDKRAQARKTESLLSLQMMNATAKLSYASAIALKRGHANGEVEDAVADYEKAKKAYYDFLNKQATENLEG